MPNWVTANHHARPDDVVIIHHITDRRGRRKFLAALGGRAICVSRNPMTCAARALLAEGRDPTMPIIFRDADDGQEEKTTLAEAAQCQLPDLGSVVRLRGPSSEGNA
ncbi:hypothetical protein [Bradyrhizobium sp. 604_D8_N2_3]|uniref:hypothetical protein n=1 Tax=Bradyrhizobium sp. 604_D8_N2_3 TaxID=3240370 RepID=UPI003F26C616